ncbi:hypothetical protein, partial [Klebsiella pneumoniae]|uniref:hypothetical protein n=1 Tax=Klebsiella pneumoniae TaxID=573 RepID=UPI001D016250
LPADTYFSSAAGCAPAVQLTELYLFQLLMSPIMPVQNYNLILLRTVRSIPYPIPEFGSGD